MHGNSEHLVLKEKNTFFEIFTSLRELLNAAGFGAQSQVLSLLMEKLESNNIESFVKALNGADMWGGSGAVWEVDLQNEASQKQFEKKVVSLINLMESVNVLGSNIKPIRKIFKANLKL